MGDPVLNCTVPKTKLGFGWDMLLGSIRFCKLAVAQKECHTPNKHSRAVGSVTLSLSFIAQIYLEKKIGSAIELRIVQGLKQTDGLGPELELFLLSRSGAVESQLKQKHMSKFKPAICQCS